jgi:hypothetical protein
VGGLCLSQILVERLATDTVFTRQRRLGLPGERHTLANPYDGVFAFHGAPQLTLDADGRLLMRRL